jgi:hypothetical protein
MTPNLLVFSTATVGSQPAATYRFMSSGYKPPRQGRSIAMDMVHNQNGIFKYVYDNGPNIHTWDPFELVFNDKFSNVVGGSATQQYANFLALWNHLGSKGFQAPDGGYQVHFAAEDMEPRFNAWPVETTSKLEYKVTVHIEEG